MTEKRFRLGYVCGDYGLIDNDEWIDLHSMSENSEKNVQICINKLNELAEENEQLKEAVWSWSKSYNRVYEDKERILNTIKYAYYNERTQLGKSVLKQLLEAIQ